MIKYLLDYLKRKRNPIAYWRKKGAKIGDDCEIYASAVFGSEPYLITVGNHVRINSGVNLITHDGGVWVLRYLSDEDKDIDLFGKIEIGDNVQIGTNATIMPGVKIGDNSIVGLGAIVTKDVPANSIVAGIPARVLKTVDEYRLQHKDQFFHTKGLSAEEKKKYILAHMDKI